MGCDIHFYVEVQEDNGSWKSADTWFEEDGSLSTYDMSDGKFVSHAFYSGRNYDLFAILANVRNGRGFAGVKTGQGFVPICEPKGVPDNASPQYLRVVEQWGVDGHSHSYLTVEELMQYDWTQTTKKSGLVGPKEFMRWKLDGKPESWCGGSSAELIENDQMENRLLQKYGVDRLTWTEFRKEDTSIFSDAMTRVEWEIPYYEAGKWFLYETMPKLWRLGSPNKVRAVFFFDN